MGANMRVAIQQTCRAHCNLCDLWRCLVGKDITPNQAVLVTLEMGDRILLSSSQLNEKDLLLHSRSHQRLAQWQLLMLPVGDGPEVEHGGLMETVRRRDNILTQLADLPARQSGRGNKLRAELSSIEARLDSLPADVFKQFQRVDAVMSKMERVEYALDQYRERTNWSPVGDDEPPLLWLWAGVGTQCERIGEPWGLAEDALEGD